MKAKEYCEKYLELLKKEINSDSIDTIAKIIFDFSDEVMELKKQRNVKTDKAFISILKEQSKKYDAMCRLVNKEVGFEYLNEGGFKEYWFKKMPVLESVWNEY